ncbi:MAG: NAD(P)-dependent oxidoreductase [Anaerolineales bacterium]|nr:NAD(P)-dependent oxidoreductase [Anaerolineales bacterium]
MTLLLTGAAGFVMSNAAQRWLAHDPAARAVLFDAAPWDPLLERFFAPQRERLTFVQGDVRDPAAWERLPAAEITHIVHGAALTPSAERERGEPRAVLDVNIMGTAAALEFARRLPNLRRFIYVSSGAVYGDAPPGEAALPVPEAGRVAPIELYAISKLAGEQITRRYSDLYGFAAASVRFSGVYGPLDRPTPARSVDCVPKKIISAALAGRPITVRALEAGGDFIHAGDVGDALTALLNAPAWGHPVYNVAYGEFVTIAALIDLVREVVPGLRAVVTPAAEITYDPAQRLARWAEYDLSRITADTGWRPRPLRTALHDYVAWRQAND